MNRSFLGWRRGIFIDVPFSCPLKNVFHGKEQHAVIIDDKSILSKQQHRPTSIDIVPPPQLITGLGRELKPFDSSNVWREVIHGARFEVAELLNFDMTMGEREFIIDAQSGIDDK
jgi:hypothetical protein